MGKLKKNEAEDQIELFHRFMILAPSRIIKLESEFDSDTGDEHGVSHSMSSVFLKNLMILEAINHDPITIILNTSGGSTEHGLAIYDAIKNSPCEITIKVYGMAYSMGSILLQAADHRLMSPNSSLMFHDGTSGSEGNHSESLNMAAHSQAISKRCDDILFDRINVKRQKMNMALMSRRTFDNMSLKSTWLFAEQAVEFGLADEVDTSPIGGSEE